jgi:hypothetical protein
MQGSRNRSRDGASFPYHVMLHLWVHVGVLLYAVSVSSKAWASAWLPDQGHGQWSEALMVGDAAPHQGQGTLGGVSIYGEYGVRSWLTLGIDAYTQAQVLSQMQYGPYWVTLMGGISSLAPFVRIPIYTPQHGAWQSLHVATEARVLGDIAALDGVVSYRSWYTEHYKATRPDVWLHGYGVQWRNAAGYSWHAPWGRLAWDGYASAEMYVQDYMQEPGIGHRPAVGTEGTVGWHATPQWDISLYLADREMIGDTWGTNDALKLFLRSHYTRGYIWAPKITYNIVPQFGVQGAVYRTYMPANGTDTTWSIGTVLRW